jgi:hypothetical protein
VNEEASLCIVEFIFDKRRLSVVEFSDKLLSESKIVNSWVS